MSIKIQLEINYSTNEVLDCPTFLIISFEKSIIEKIKKVSSFVRGNDLYCAQQSIPSPDYYIGDIEEEEEIEPLDYKISNNSIIIKSYECFIKGYISTDYVESEYFDVGYLEELFHLKELPIEHMPLYINDEDENIKNIAMERLRGE